MIAAAALCAMGAAAHAKSDCDNSSARDCGDAPSSSSASRSEQSSGGNDDRRAQSGASTSSSGGSGSTFENIQVHSGADDD